MAAMYLSYRFNLIDMIDMNKAPGKRTESQK
jgi:hypothetical protein